MGMSHASKGRLGLAAGRVGKNASNDSVPKSQITKSCVTLKKS